MSPVSPNSPTTTPSRYLGPLITGGFLVGWPVVATVSSLDCLEESIAFGISAANGYSLLLFASLLPYVSIIIGSIMVGAGVGLMLRTKLPKPVIRIVIGILAATIVAISSGAVYSLISFDRCFG